MIPSDTRGATSIRQLSENKNAVGDGENEDSQPHLSVRPDPVRRYLSPITGARPARPTLLFSPATHRPIQRLRGYRPSTAAGSLLPRVNAYYSCS
jgi:hypothetical protein